MRLAIYAFAFAAALALGCTRAQPAVEPVEAPRPSAVAPADEVEREILLHLPALAPGQPKNVGGAVVVAEAPYPAASGRTCRALSITGAGGVERTRLACREDEEWFFVPQIFQSEGNDASAP